MEDMSMNVRNVKQATCNFFQQHNGTAIVRRIGHKRRIPVRSTEFVEVTNLVPIKWTDWFWSSISENAPFSWGDNNRSFVDAQSFANHCEDRIFDLNTEESTTYGARREWLKKIRNLGQMYIDLEN